MCCQYVGPPAHAGAAWIGVLALLSPCPARMAPCPGVDLMAAFAGMVLRYRSAHAVARRQYRWVLSGIAFVLVALAIGLTGSAFGGADDGPWWLPILLAYVLLPVSFMVAILRYRLYEIDRLISRTLSYGLLTVLLISVYVGIAVVPTVLFDVRSDLLVAAATLAAAAVFRPLRQRVQTAVDRRFNRARYDTVRTVEAFSTRLRGKTGVAVLVDDVTDVVGATVQPASVSVWLRQG